MKSIHWFASGVGSKEIKIYSKPVSGKSIEKKYQQSKLELESMYKPSIHALERAEDNLEDLFIRSTIDGKVYPFLKTRES